MATADNRITIRDVKTGELRHGIKGHVPAGFEEYKAASGDKVADRTVASRPAKSAPETAHKPSVQNVRSTKGSDTSKPLPEKPKPTAKRN